MLRGSHVGVLVRRLAIGMAAGAIIVAWHLHGAAQGTEPPPPTVWDGVYTDAQAERGTVVFAQNCARCHTLGPEGEGPLVGERFWAGYAQRTVGDLLAYVSKNMPNGNGGSLPAASYNDVVALILRSNGLPAGTIDLDATTGTAARIVQRDGSGKLPANTLVRVVGCLAGSRPDWILTNATAPERSDQTGPAPEDATRPLGERTFPLRFVLTNLDSFVGQRLSVSGLLIGAGGSDGINVTTVNRVAESCP